MYWTLERIMDCAAGCKTYGDFVRRFPLAYKSAVNRGWLGVLVHHCGWEKVNRRVIDDPMRKRYRIKGLINDDGTIQSNMFEDPFWPLDTNSDPPKEVMI